MSPNQLKTLLIDLHTAAEVVEALHDPDLQARRGWDLRNWSYRSIPWGVIFIHRQADSPVDTEILAALSWEATQQARAMRLGEANRAAAPSLQLG